MDYAAGNFFTGVPGWLGCEVIWLAVDDYRAANHVRHPETACQHCHPGVSAASKQRREIACVAGVAAIALGVVAARLGKSCSSAGTALVDVEAKDFRAALGQSAYICRHQCAGGTAVERDGSDGPGGRVRAVYVCDGLWTAKGKIHAGTSQSERGRAASAVEWIPLYTPSIVCRRKEKVRRAATGSVPPVLALPYEEHSAPAALHSVSPGARHMLEGAPFPAILWGNCGKIYELYKKLQVELVAFSPHLD